MKFTEGCRIEKEMSFLLIAALYDASLRVQSFLIEVLRLTFQVLQQTCLANHAVVSDIERRVFI